MQHTTTRATIPALLAALALAAGCGSNSDAAAADTAATAGATTGGTATTGSSVITSGSAAAAGSALAGTSPSAQVATSGSALTSAAPGSGTAPSGSAAPASYPLTIENCGRSVTFTQAPKRVVILNGNSMAEAQTMVLLGLDAVVFANAQHYAATDAPETSDKIEALPDGGLVPNKNRDIPAEQVLAAKPDLVLGTAAASFDAKFGLATRDQLAGAGINSLINPAKCAAGAPAASAAAKRAYANRTISSSYELITLLGNVFGVPDRAAAVIDNSRQRLAAVAAAVKGRPAKNVLIAYPGMSMMNSNGLPAVMTGKLYDDILAAAGARNVFAGADTRMTSKLNAEQFAAADVELLALGRFKADDDPKKLAEQLFSQYPQWPAADQKRYVAIADSVYFGPLNYLAVEKIAKAVHPDADW